MKKGFFGTDSALFRFLTVLMELAQMNLLFLLYSLPLFTAGAAYSAMLDGLYTLSRKGEGCFSVSRFHHVFCKCVKNSVKIWCPGALGGILLVYGILYWMKASDGMVRILICGVYAAVGILLFGTLQYSLFCLARTFEWSKERLKDCFLLALAKYPVVILMFLITISWLVLLMLPGANLIRLLPLIALYCIVSPAYACVFFDIKILKPVMPALFEEE